MVLHQILICLPLVCSWDFGYDDSTEKKTEEHAMQHILVCDDEEDIVAALKIYLEDVRVLVPEFC